jgi:hypothetical protein
VLAALIANNQNVVRGFDHRDVEVRSRANRDGGRSSRSWPTGDYDAVDIAEAMRLFPEATDEHPAARTARWARWVGEVLPKIREARERDRAAAFLAGATVGQLAIFDQVRVEAAKFEAMREAYVESEARANAATAELARVKATQNSGGGGGRSGGGTLLAVGAVLLVVALLAKRAG